MLKTKILLPVILGFLFTFGLIWELVDAKGDQAFPQANTHTVCAGGCNYDSTQEAIGNAAPYDTIDLASETYTETFIQIGLALAAPTANIIYVDSDNVFGPYNGDSWATAYTTLQDALSIAASGDEIWVAEGVYFPDEGSGQINDAITSTFVLKNDVALYGGFDPSSGVEEFSEHDSMTYITVLSGDIDHETLPDITDPNGVITTSANIIGNNAYHVISNVFVDETAELDGFVITAGQANGVFFPNYYGGGMYNYIHSSPTLARVTFSGNSARIGSGMSNLYDSNPILTHVTFSGNSAYGTSFFEGGGGIYNIQSNPTLINVIFSDNSADSNGGGLCNHYSNPTLINVTFSNNSAIGYGGGMVNFDHSYPLLTNVIMWGNVATTTVSSQISNTLVSMPIISYSDIQGSGGSVAWDSSLGTDGGNNIDADPQFISVYDDLHLGVDSPAIDAGTNTGCPSTDLDGTPRPIGPFCDMGAYEFEYSTYFPLILK